MRLLETLALTSLFLAAGAVQAGTLEQPFEKTYDLRPGMLISLDNTNGSIEIRTAADNRAHIHAVKRVEGWGSTSLSKAMAQLKIDVAQDAGGLRIATKYPHQNGDGFFAWLAGEKVNYSVSYTLEVPKESNLTIETVNGHIEVTDVSGALKLDTTNGRIEVARCRGAINAETTNGHIKAELLNVTGGKPMHFETTNGGITVKVPRNLAASIDAANTNGSINTELPITSTGKLSRHFIRGNMNGGGPELRLRTTNGSISILGL